jgi:hypothetical protein
LVGGTDPEEGTERRYAEMQRRASVKEEDFQYRAQLRSLWSITRTAVFGGKNYRI